MIITKSCKYNLNNEGWYFNNDQLVLGKAKIIDFIIQENKISYIIMPTGVPFCGTWDNGMNSGNNDRFSLSEEEINQYIHIPFENSFFTDKDKAFRIFFEMINEEFKTSCDRIGKILTLQNFNEKFEWNKEIKLIYKDDKIYENSICQG